MSTEFRYVSGDLGSTKRLAQAIAASLRQSFERSPRAMTVCLSGTLGAGKTTFVSFFCGELGVETDDVTSPTFALQNVYSGTIPINHFDFYRIKSEDELFEIGFEETIELPAIHLIEWPEKFSSCLPESYLRLIIETVSANERVFELIEFGESTGLVDRTKSVLTTTP